MIEIISTGDGSHTLRNTQIGETYHSVHGAVQESIHVFIRYGFQHVIASGKGSINLLEVGFGTGLNAFLTLKESSVRKVRVNYTALEPHPVEEEIWAQLNYATTEDEIDLFRRIHEAQWHEATFLQPWFSLRKLKHHVQEAELASSHFDLIYFDAFAPEKQPDMWTPDTLSLVAGCMKQGSALVTYCAKGQLKRDLRTLGFNVESLQGPPGKREMIRAIKA